MTAAVAVGAAGAGDTSNGATYPSTSFTPVAGDLLVVLCEVSGSLLANGAAGTCSSTANGITFTRVADCLTQGGGGTMMVFVARQFVPSSPASMICNVSVNGNNGTGAVVAVARVSGTTVAGVAALRQFVAREQQTSGTTLAATLAAAALVDNVVFAIMCNASNPAGVTPPTSFTEGGDAGYITPTAGFEWASRVGHTSATVTWGSNSGSAWSAMVLELSVFGSAVALTGTGTLSATGTVVSSAALSGSGTLAASGGLGASDSAALSGVGTLSGAGAPGVVSSAALSGSGTLSGAGSPSPTGAAALSGEGTLQANPVEVDVSGVTGLSGEGTLTASGYVPGAPMLSGEGTLLVTVGLPALVAAAALAGEGTLNAVGIRHGPNRDLRVSAGAVGLRWRAGSPGRRWAAGPVRLTQGQAP